MNEIYDSPETGFVSATRSLLLCRKQYGSMYHCRLTPNHNYAFEDEIFDRSWGEYKEKYKGGRLISWGRFLIEAVFPDHLYIENGRSLINLINDKRFNDEPSATKKGTFHSHIGRMCRPREVFDDTEYVGYLDYTLDRWSRGNHRSYPHFFFDCESPEWMFRELFVNPNQIRSGRVANSCTSNIAFRWDSKSEKAYIYQILKHTQWSHLYGDFCGTASFARAFCSELSIPMPSCNIVIFAVSATMDRPKQAKMIVHDFDERYLQND